MSSHSWKFFRAGGFDQVKLESGADLMNLDQLDQKLWVALACPTSGIEFDKKTAALIDTDKDGRIRAPELIAACKWAGGLLRNPDSLLQGSKTLPLAAINDAVPEGKVILAAARQILANLGRKDGTEIGLEEVADTARIFAQTLFNGDGVVPADSAEDAATKAVIADAIATVGSVPDRSGKPGINADLLAKFFAELAAFEAWNKKGEDDAAAIHPLGAGTAAAAAAVRAVKAKVDDFFARCRLAAYDPRAINALNREEKEYLAIAAKDLTITAAEIAGFPLAQVAAGKALPLKSGLNPAWAAAIAALDAAAVQPVLGARDALTEADWTALTGRLGAHECWNSGKPSTAVEKLGLARVREILGSGARDAITGLLARDKALEGEVNAIGAVEKLVRFHRDLYLLCTNFVNFRDLYDGGDPAVFQVGTLYLDQRSCNLCISVEDPGRHALMAGLAGAYLAYVDCVRKGTGEKMSIVAVFSQGDDDNLMVGRNGVFYDRKGLDYDATITKILANPISIRQAFFSPYKKFVRMLEEQISKRAAAADSAAQSRLAAAAEATANAEKVAAPAAKPEEKKFDVGVIAALSVAFGSLGTAAAYALGLFKTPAQAALAVVGLVAIISGPSVILAYIKLRKRNLGPILDANGWAVNAKARINVPFGTSLTGIAKLPPGAQVDAADTFAEKQVPWKRWVVLAVLLVLGFKYYSGDFDGGLPSGADSVSVLRGFASPKAKAAADERETKALDKKAKRAAADAAAAAATNAPAAK